MSFITKLFPGLKKVKVQSVDLVQATEVVANAEKILAGIKAALADGKIDIGEIIGLIVLVAGLFHIGNRGSPEA